MIVSRLKAALHLLHRKHVPSGTILWIIIILNLLPLAYMVGVSLKPEEMVFRQPLSPISIPITFENYTRVWRLQPILVMLYNSTAVALGVTVGQIFLAILGAYGFSRYRFAFSRILFGLVLVSMMVPFVVTYLPNYLMMARMNLLNTRLGMIIPMLGLGLGFPLFLLRQHFMAFPTAITDAARIDGSNDWQILWRIMVPGCFPAVVAVGVYVLIICWNQYIWPLLVAESINMYTLTVGIVSFTSGEGGAMWGAVMAASTITTLPTMILFLILRQSVIENLSQGALK
jgi:sn-glycerol 3-phosphate transport system permease protein